MSLQRGPGREDVSQGYRRLLPWYKAGQGPILPRGGRAGGCGRLPATRPESSWMGIIWPFFGSDPSPQPQLAVSIVPLTHLPPPCLCGVCSAERPLYGASASPGLMASMPLPGTFMCSLHKYSCSRRLSARCWAEHSGNGTHTVSAQTQTVPPSPSVSAWQSLPKPSSEAASLRSVKVSSPWLVGGPGCQRPWSHAQERVQGH